MRACVCVCVTNRGVQTITYSSTRGGGKPAFSSIATCGGGERLGMTCRSGADSAFPLICGSTTHMSRSAACRRSNYSVSPLHGSRNGAARGKLAKSGALMQRSPCALHPQLYPPNAPRTDPGYRDRKHQIQKHSLGAATLQRETGIPSWCSLTLHKNTQV